MTQIRDASRIWPRRAGCEPGFGCACTTCGVNVLDDKERRAVQGATLLGARGSFSPENTAPVGIVYPAVAPAPGSENEVPDPETIPVVRDRDFG